MLGYRWVAQGLFLLGTVGTVPLEAQLITSSPPATGTIRPLTTVHYASPFISDSLVSPVGLTVRCDAGGSNNCSFKLAPGAGVTSLQYRLLSRTGGDCGSIPASTTWAALSGTVTLASDLPRNNPASNTCALVFDFRVLGLDYVAYQAGTAYSRAVIFSISKP